MKIIYGIGIYFCRLHQRWLSCYCRHISSIITKNIDENDNTPYRCHKFRIIRDTVKLSESKAYFFLDAKFNAIYLAMISEYLLLYEIGQDESRLRFWNISNNLYI